LASNRSSESSKWSIASRDYYDSLEEEFEAMNEFWENPYDLGTWRMENELVSRNLCQDDPLLDLGVGFYPHIESTAGKNLICLDISCRSLAVARKVYHEYNQKMEYVCADAMCLPFVDGAFEGIVAGGELINHLPGQALLKEMHRVLRPAGRVVLSVGMKWCLDSMYAILDAITGNSIGYRMTRSEATQFVQHPLRSTEVTWEVTPKLDLRVTLYSRRDIKAFILLTRFHIVKICSLNLLSAIVPLPIQQNARIHTLLHNIITFLLSLDRCVACVPGLRWLAGNVYLVLEKT
jgi:ubiquinone/menaquinone biosynthesis C-methylase UbiE